MTSKANSKPDTDAPTITIETITPDMAKALLEKNIGNRSIRQLRVETYAEQMRSGRWLLTGEAITLNGDRLLNGQHRLLACIKANMPFTTVVARGIASDAYKAIDGGLSRTTADRLGHRGLPDPTVSAAAGRLIYGYRAGILADRTKLNIMASSQVVEDIVASDVERWATACAIGRKARAAIQFNQSAMAAFYVLLVTDINEELVTDFIDGLLSGVRLAEGDPRLALRSWVLNAKRRTNVDQLSALIRAWNAHVKGTRLAYIKPWVSGQPFPAYELV